MNCFLHLHRGPAFHAARNTRTVCHTLHARPAGSPSEWISVFFLSSSVTLAKSFHFWESASLSEKRGKEWYLPFYILISIYSTSCLPRWHSGKESTCQCGGWGFDPWVGKILWRRKWQPTPVFLPGRSYGQRSLAGYSPRDHKESDMT